MQPWQLTREEWERQREEIRPNVAQSGFTRSSASQAVARHEKLLWLLYGIHSQDKVTWQDVIRKALDEGKLTKCPRCEKVFETAAQPGWFWDEEDRIYRTWCTGCKNTQTRGNKWHASKPHTCTAKWN